MGIALLVSAQLKGQDSSRILIFTPDIEFETIQYCNKKFNLADEHIKLYYNLLDYNGHGIHPLNLFIVCFNNGNTGSSNIPGNLYLLYYNTSIGLINNLIMDQNLKPVEQELNRLQKAYIVGLNIIGWSVYLHQSGGKLNKGIIGDKMFHRR